MRHRDRNILLIFTLCIFLWVGGCTQVKHENLLNVIAQCNRESQEDRVVCRGLDWLIKNRVDIVKDGFLELGEELNLFYILYLKSDNPAEKSDLKEYITSRVDYLLNTHTLKVDYAGEVTAYLNFAKIMKRLEIERPHYWEFIEKDILVNSMTYPPNITYTILNTALIEDIGAVPKVPFTSLINQGIIARFALHPELIPVGKAYASPDDIMNFFYDVTHEVFAISNFGDRDPRQYLLDDELEFLKKILSEGVSRYMEKDQVDILAELIVCAKMIGYRDFNGFDAAVQHILDSQKEDGSFGTIERMVFLGRPNVHRHGVLVALWALVG
jgi:hypothetical protein